MSLQRGLQCTAQLDHQLRVRVPQIAQIPVYLFFLLHPWRLTSRGAKLAAVTSVPCLLPLDTSASPVKSLYTFWIEWLAQANLDADQYWRFPSILPPACNAWNKTCSIASHCQPKSKERSTGHVSSTSLTHDDPIRFNRLSHLAACLLHIRSGTRRVIESPPSSSFYQAIGSPLSLAGTTTACCRRLLCPTSRIVCLRRSIAILRDTLAHSRTHFTSNPSWCRTLACCSGQQLSSSAAPRSLLPPPPVALPTKNQRRQRQLVPPFRQQATPSLTCGPILLSRAKRTARVAVTSAHLQKTISSRATTITTILR